MGKFSAILLVMISLMWCCHTRKTVVEFNLVGTSGMKPEILMNGSEYLIDANEAGYARLVMKEGEKGYATLKYGKDRIPLFIEEGESLIIYIYGDQASGNTRFEGSGAAKSVYLNSLELKNSPFEYELDGMAFLQQLEDVIAKKISYLDTLEFDEAFKEMERNRIKFSIYTVLENYPLYHAWSTGNKDYQLDTAYIKRVEAFIKEDESLLELKEYREGMASLISVISTAHLNEYDAHKRALSQFDYVRHHLTNRTLMEFLIDHYTYDYLLGAGADENLREMLRVYDSYVKDAKMRKRFYDGFERCMKIVPGKLALNFLFTDVAGQAFRLEDFRGKYLLINVWATWGVPCRNENVSWEKLEKEFEEERIVFVAVACDKDRATWEKQVRENPKGEIQLYMGSDRTFMDFYMIRGIPRFILISPDGRIINSDMPRPSDPETAKILRNYLKSKN